MKLNIIPKLIWAMVVGSLFTSCLEGDEMNTPPLSNRPAIVEMSFVPAGGTTLNTGLRYFGGQALLMSPAVDTVTYSFAVTIQGAVNRDVNVTLQLKPENALDNIANDGLEYGVMTPDMYRLVSTTATIPAGETFAEFQIEFYPPFIDFTASTILPITVTNDAEIITSSNYGMFYPHIIGNAIAGLYWWDFIRYSTPDPVGSPDGLTFYDHDAVFSPVDPTTILVPTGYYTGINYIITFDDDEGVLSNFKAVLDPAGITAWEADGITVTEGPTLTVSPDHKEFSINYRTLTRNVTDIYTLK
jgi:hypothetical protein